MTTIERIILLLEERNIVPAEPLRAGADGQGL